MMTSTVMRAFPSVCRRCVSYTQRPAVLLAVRRSISSLSDLEAIKFQRDASNNKTKRPIGLAGIKHDGSTKRFFKSVDVAPVTDPATGAQSWAVELGGRSITTAQGHAFTLPTLRLARAIALEWESQRDRIVYSSMPLTNLAIAAIDRARHERPEFIERFTPVLAIDAATVRIDQPAVLSKLQKKHWDPLMKWINDHHGIAMTVTEELDFVSQSDASQEALLAILNNVDEWTLASLDSLVSIGKSLIFALAVVAGRLPLDAAYEVSRIEENYQMRTYGEIHGIYGHQVDIQFTKMQIAAVRTFLNLSRTDADIAPQAQNQP